MTAKIVTPQAEEIEKRIRNPKVRDKIMSAEQAAQFVKDGMVVGMSGFTRAGDVKFMPSAMAAKAAQEPFRITLVTGASLGHDSDKILCDAGILAKRMPFQVDTTLRKAINRGEVLFIDQHLSETVELLRSQQMPAVDCAIIEAVAITEDGGIVPTTSVGNSASFVEQAEHVIVEINMTNSPAFEGLHDIYIPVIRPGRGHIPLMTVRDRIGETSIKVPVEKIKAVIFTDMKDSPSPVLPADNETDAIAKHLSNFFIKEVEAGRMGHDLMPIQAGIGTIANAVLTGFVDSPFKNLTMYSEVLQDSTFALFDAGKLDFASASSITISEECANRVFTHIENYKDRLVLRPQEISNHPEIIRRLGIIAINTALEFDIYGNVNSTHVNGTHMMNGIGGSGDFARNAIISVFVTKSMAKEGKISSVVPMVTHVDHTEHDVDILVTEVGLADLRGLAPRERAVKVIENCVHPHYRPMLEEYFHEACRTAQGHTPHLIDRAFAWHHRAMTTGTMAEGS